MKALLLIGSPKGKKSASGVLGWELARRMETHGVTVEEMTLSQEMRSEKESSRTLVAFEAADLIVASFPVYSDALPFQVTRLLELSAARLAGKTDAPRARFAVIVQCGFPEAHQCDTAIALCRLFAERCGLRWAGALAMGMGGPVGNGIDKLPRGGKRLLEAIESAAASLAAGNAIQAEAAALFAKPLMPRWLYLAAGNLGWRLQMWKNRARHPIAYRPLGRKT